MAKNRSEDYEDIPELEADEDIPNEVLDNYEPDDNDYGGYEW